MGGLFIEAPSLKKEPFGVTSPLETFSNSSSKANLRGDDCPSLIKTTLTISLVDVETQHTSSSEGLDIWSVDKYVWNIWPNNRYRIDSDTILEFGLLSLHQPQKLAQNVRIAQVYKDYFGLVDVGFQQDC